MRLSTQALLIILASSGEDTAAFAPSSLLQARRQQHYQHHEVIDHSHKVVLQAMSDLPDDSPAPVKKKVLTAADVMAKSKSLGTTGGGDPSAPGEQDAPKLFSSEIYDDFQSSLLTLEKRIKEGPGSLSSEEVAMLEEETVRIVKEMKEFMEDPKGAGEKIRKGYEGESTDSVIGAKVETVEAAVEEPKSTPPPPPVAPAPPAVSTAPAKASAAQTINTIPSEDEPTDAATNYGVAKGTTNTYLIPGMDEMSAEEYRDNLQKTISARQAQRRALATSNNKGKIGNASSQGYLDALAPGGGSGFPGGGKADVEAKVETVEAVVEEPKSTQSVSLRSLVQQPPPPPVAAPSPPPVAAAPPAASAAQTINTIPSEEELTYSDEPTDAATNYGVAKGTTNTYLIPGMDEMSAEEYRDNLQKTIIERQAQRRANSLKDTGKIGNANSQGYLDHLGGGGGVGSPGGGSGSGMKPRWNKKG